MWNSKKIRRCKVPSLELHVRVLDSLILGPADASEDGEIIRLRMILEAKEEGIAEG